MFLPYEKMWDMPLGGTSTEKQIPHWFGNLVWIVVGAIFKLFFRYRVDGRENLRGFKDKRGVLVVANHTSFLDVAFMYLAARPSQWVRLIGRAWARSPSSATAPTAPPSNAPRAC